MHQPDPAVFFVGVLPVGGAGDGRTDAAQDPDAEGTGGEPRGVDHFLGGAAGQHAERIQGNGGGERPAGQ
ncbi:hypothetical protein ATCCBAA256_20710 [Mycobacterium montefiorense]|nr:hypothetical protein ATCCBAA256_20710 [Mycobacterium montefiorense]